MKFASETATTQSSPKENVHPQSRNREKHGSGEKSGPWSSYHWYLFEEPDKPAIDNAGDIGRHPYSNIQRHKGKQQDFQRNLKTLPTSTIQPIVKNNNVGQQYSSDYYPDTDGKNYSFYPPYSHYMNDYYDQSSGWKGSEPEFPILDKLSTVLAPILLPIPIILCLLPLLLLPIIPLALFAYSVSGLPSSPGNQIQLPPPPFCNNSNMSPSMMGMGMNMNNNGMQTTSRPNNPPNQQMSSPSPPTNQQMSMPSPPASQPMMSSPTSQPTTTTTTSTETPMGYVRGSTGRANDNVLTSASTINLTKLVEILTTPSMFLSPSTSSTSSSDISLDEPLLPQQSTGFISNQLLKNASPSVPLLFLNDTYDNSYEMETSDDKV